MPAIDPVRLEAAYQTALAALLIERTPAGHWVGELSTSALSTATAVMALCLVERRGESGTSATGASNATLIANGLRWLAQHQNADGGWGDTVKSFSNISTTMLCRSAFHLTGIQLEHAETVSRAEAWLGERYGTTPQALAEAIRQRYGKDRTFATPILTTCALAGLVEWCEVPPLPFELAALPQSWFRFVRLHVVSYALPALIAIGQVIEHHHPTRNPVARLARKLTRRRTLRVLEQIQPSSGGYLEAIPLTSFVTLSLAACGFASHPVAQNGIHFLKNAVLPDGSWAIDSNLATWVTTLSINALATAGELDHIDRKDALRDWLLNQQYKERHPFTGAAPGGWAWTDLPGGVPDADDTPGALLALTNLNVTRHDSLRDGILWLANLQNRDGGIPTFCRGWGALPFDRSGTDLTAHALRAVARWYDLPSSKKLSPEIVSIEYAMEWIFDSGPGYLARTQRPDGSWLPLWFGNQHASDDENPTYGTARVLAAYRDLGRLNDEPARRGLAWLVKNQNDDGGWGGCHGTPSSVEETALAVEVLLGLEPSAAARGLQWLIQSVEQGGLYDPTPIGFYFAKLWYYEKLYPIIFAVAALGRARRERFDPP
jgi:squalene-hopene/tetraprenyl-beta-curcumene cyclase